MRNAPTSLVLVLALALLSSTIRQTVIATERTSPQRKTVPSLVAFCDLVSNPRKYNGKEITTRASFRYGFEWQEVFCLACEGGAKVWLEFSEDLTEKSKSALKKTPKDHGIINAVFTGTFRTSGPYGDGGYRFELEVKEARNVEVVFKGLEHQKVLPAKVRKRMCISVTRSRSSLTASKDLAVNRSKTSDA